MDYIRELRASLVEDFGPKILEFLGTTSQNNNVKGEFLSGDRLVIYPHLLLPIKKLQKPSGRICLGGDILYVYNI